MSESGREATAPNIAIPDDDEIHGANGVIMSLITVEGAILQILSQEQNIWSPILSIEMSVFVIYVIAMYCATCCSTRCRILEKITILLGALSATLPLLIIAPPFGWFILGIWVISFLAFAKKNHLMLFEVDYRSILEMLISIMWGPGPQSNENASWSGESSPISP